MIVGVGVFFGVFFDVYFFDFDFFFFIVNFYFYLIIVGDWCFRLGDLVGFWVIWVEVVFMVKVYFFGYFGV